MAQLIGRERTLHATRRAPAHTPDMIRYTTPGDTIGRTTICALAAGPLRDAAAWIEAYRSFWDERLDALETYLAEEEP